MPGQTTRNSQKTTQRVRRNIDLEVQAEIEELGAQGWSAVQIHRHLDQQRNYTGRLPTLRTVQRIVSNRTPRDNSGPWTLQTAGSDARVVLDVLAAVTDETEGRTTQFTQEEARWVAQVTQVAGDLPPFERWRIARLYLGRATRGESTDDLDGFLAYAPWRDGEAGWRRYDRATMEGWIQHVPYFLTRTIQFGSTDDRVIDGGDLAEADQAEQADTRGWQRAMKRGGLAWHNMRSAEADDEGEVNRG